ncbi:MAG: hypothetical protein MUD12_15580 [Spirochaetes bacterium]|jgi:UDP-N-acetylglucosamine diphosphorylase/glucosamine-1-phosphate N-acetyltransferase|nr:hypothetical protein [Spirochaetota bacterium]
MNIIIFEDGSADGFYPVSLTRPLWEIRSGAFSFRERMENFASSNFPGSKIYLHTRDYLAPYFREKYPGLKINEYPADGETLLVSSTVYPGTDIAGLEPGSSIRIGGRTVAVNVPPGMISSDFGKIINDGSVRRMGPGETGSPSSIVGFIWDLVGGNSLRISGDFDFFGNRTSFIPDNVTILGERGHLYIEEGAIVDQQVVIDLRGGPVIIRGGTKIYPFTYLQGPCYVGRNCVLSGARVREGVSIGDCCRIGGEVEDSIFHGFSNKYHDGFIGHSYVGEWVNLGAMTSNSDLKNNYSNVSVHLPGGRVDTGQKKVGCFVGDFVKASIGTLINTGSVLGTGAMLVHSGALTPAHVPPFRWFIGSSVENRDWFQGFIKTAAEMMSRRGMEFSDSLGAVLDYLYRNQ